MKKQSSKSCSVFWIVCLIGLMGALFSGCASFHAWGEKSSSTPGSVGGGVSIPLGKK